MEIETNRKSLGKSMEVDRIDGKLAANLEDAWKEASSKVKVIRHPTNVEKGHKCKRTVNYPDSNRSLSNKIDTFCHSNRLLSSKQWTREKGQGRFLVS